MIIYVLTKIINIFQANKQSILTSSKKKKRKSLQFSVFSGYKQGILVQKHPFAILTGRHLCWSPLLITLEAIRSAYLLKREFNRGSPVNIANFLRTVLFGEPLRWLVLTGLKRVTFGLCASKNNTGLFSSLKAL